MAIRKNPEETSNKNIISNGSDKDNKYSDRGRDGDYTTEKPASIEEGDEDYDDETQENRASSNRRENDD